ncbi:MAG TPA: hypothetical protein VJI46_04685 [Candidatus Nanoarchaeia archaeon]|nr:hypothetical protein [Candidatus Nanoarchaeia archaeon]
MKAKRGSLDISINAIIVIVLAFTFLALALTFIKGIFVDIQVPIEGSIEQVKTALRNQLISTGDRLSIELNSYTLQKNSEDFIVFAVANKKDGKLNYRIEISEVGEQSPTSSTSGSGGINLPSGAGFQWDSSNQVLEVVGEGSAKADTIKYFSPSVGGSYQYKIVIWDIDDEEYASKSFFVKVS